MSFSPTTFLFDTVVWSRPQWCSISSSAPWGIEGPLSATRPARTYAPGASHVSTSFRFRFGFRALLVISSTASFVAGKK